MKPFSRLQNTVITKAEQLRREYLWIIIGILLFGHLIWLGWVVYTDFFLIPKATITRDQDEELQRDVEEKNKFAPSYSFYDSWGNLSGKLDATELDLVFRAEVVEGIGKDIKIFVEKDGEERLLETIDADRLAATDRLSWNDILVPIDSEQFIMLDEARGIEGNFWIFKLFSANDLKVVNNFEYADYGEGYSVESMLSDGGKLYFVSRRDKGERAIMSLDLATERFDSLDSYNTLYVEDTTEQSNKYVSDIRLTGLFMEKYMVYEKVFHFGNTFNYSQTAINIETGESDIFTSDTVKGIY